MWILKTWCLCVDFVFGYSDERTVNKMRDSRKCTVSLATVRLVSHDPSFCYDGRTVEINTPLESSWSKKLKYITFDFNRGQSDELEQVINSAARSVNRFL